MITAYEDNLDAVLAGLGVPADGQELHQTHTLKVLNDAPYAIYVHMREGLYVFDDAVASGIVHKWIADLARQTVMPSRDEIEEALAHAGSEIVDFLQSLTNEMRPPLRKGGPERPAHPGGWANVTEQLVQAYRAQVNGKDVALRTVTLELG